MDLLTATISDLADAIRSKKVSALEVSDFFNARIDRLDPKINSFVSRDFSAREQARNIDAKIARGEDVGPIAGVPIGIKDMICTQGLRTTAGSKILESFIPPYDATLVQKIKSAGGVIIGKLNLDEFAMGSSNETSAYGVCKNPWNLDYVPGGSSGGSAAAQAARFAMATIGTDTGGSIRQPASFCGVVGVKPTYGRVSRYGIVAYASSLDQAGPMATSVEDAACILEIICGGDPKDSTSSHKAVPKFKSMINSDLKKTRIGILKEFMVGGLDPSVEKAVEKAIETVRLAGGEVIEVSIPLTRFAVPIYYLIATSEASSNLARYDGIKYGFRAPVDPAKGFDLEQLYSSTRALGFGSEVQRRIIIGTYCLSNGYYEAYYNKACQVRRLLKEQYDAAFAKCDVILSPVSASPAFKIGERIDDPLAMYLNDIFTTSTNLAGLPGMSVPFALSNMGLPIGIQLTANQFQEQNLFNVGQALEIGSQVKGARPNVFE